MNKKLMLVLVAALIHVGVYAHGDISKIIATLSNTEIKEQVKRAFEKQQAELIQLKNENKALQEGKKEPAGSYGSSIAQDFPGAGYNPLIHS